MATVRRVTSGDAAALRELRLRALQVDPVAFASSYQQEAAWPEERWHVWAAASAEGDDQALYVAEEGGGPVALAGAYRPEHSPRSLRLVAMWVAPEHRGKGVGRRLTEAIVEWARGADADEVTLWVVESNAPARHVYESCGFEVTGTTQPLPSHPELVERLMRLRLRDAGPGPGRVPEGYVELQPMSTSEFEGFLAWTIADHTARLMDLLGLSRADAEAEARKSIAEELPEGPIPTNHHPCTIRAGVDDATVGWVWFSERTEQAAILDIVVFERHRNRGLGAAAVAEVEEWARLRGLSRIVLDVFADNDGAQRFYERIGFTVAAEHHGFRTLHLEL
jgi:ribosomal protein S18 acetylase RimI-like enzyme